MEFLNNTAIRQWAYQAFAVFFLIGGLVGLAVGASLFFNSERTLRFLGSLNRWVSMRGASKPLEIPRNSTKAVQKFRLLLAVFFVAGALFALFILTMKFNAHAAIAMLGLDTLRAPIAAWIVESARWILVAGNLAAIAVGIMLGFYPSALTAIEAGGSHWYSERKYAKTRDEMHLSLDKWVAAFPRTTGVIFMLTTLILVGNFGFILLGMR